VGDPGQFLAFCPVHLSGRVVPRSSFPAMDSRGFH
jgi:hypothetical protein